MLSCGLKLEGQLEVDLKQEIRGKPVRILRRSDVSFHPFQFVIPHTTREQAVRNKSSIQIYVKGNTEAPDGMCFQEQFVRSPRWMINCRNLSRFCQLCFRLLAAGPCCSALQPTDGGLESGKSQGGAQTPFPLRFFFTLWMRFRVWKPLCIFRTGHRAGVAQFGPERCHTSQPLLL